MLDESLLEASMAKQRELLVSGQVQPSELTAAYLDRIAREDEKIHAFLHLDPDHAMQQAKQLDAIPVAERDEYRLFGMSIAVCDRYSIQGLPTTMGSSLLPQIPSPTDSGEVESMKADGAVMFGKTNCAEFALSSRTVSRKGGECHNPFKLSCSAGGADGGAGAAVAAGFASAAVAADAMGSGRLAAAWCGASAIKPTHGRYEWPSSKPVPPSKRLFFQPCPITRSVSGIDMFLRGRETREREQRAALGVDGFKGKKVAWVSELAGIRPDPAMLSKLEVAVQAISDLGAEVESIQLNEITDSLFDHFGTILASDACTPILSILQAQGQDLSALDEDTQRWVELGMQATGAQYSMAMTYQHWMHNFMHDLFHEYDLLVTPATASSAEQPKAAWSPSQPFASLMQDWAFLMPFNLSGQPAIVIPCGRFPDGLPASIQICAHCGDDFAAIDAAYDFEQRTGCRQVIT